MASIFKIRDENGQIIEIPAFRGKQGEPGIQGDKGEDGVGIQSIEKTNTDGLVDTYTITMTDGNTSEFTVTNGNLENLVTPQMFGAVGDGVADDTEAVQAALDAGGIIYFPAGRYKTTRLLTVSKSCRIEMFKQYPNTYKKEYPLTPDDNWMGARIDTYSPDGGMIIGDAVEVDGLYIRAMEGFAGVVLKFDNTIGTYTYPASARLKHIKLEIDSPNTIPVSMFDFLPDGSYHYILEDICLGRNGDAGYCEYGFRTDMTQTNRKWANNVTIRNLCIDLHADYPLYIAGDPSGMIRGWVFDVLTIQSYVYTNNDKNTTNRTGHINLMTLKNLHLATFIGSYLWDVQEDSLVGDIISAENVTSTSAIGCSPHFDVIEGYLSPKMKAPENLNLTNLEMTVTDNVDGTANTLRLSDGTNEKIVDIPKVEMSDEHIGSAINTWMDANAEPREEAGKNKFNPEDDGCFKAFFQASGDKWILNTTVSTERWVTGYIKACAGDIIRVSYDGALTRPHQIGCYNANNEVVDVLGNFAYEQKNGIEIIAEGTTAIRVEFYHTSVTYENRENQKICITVNNADVIYEDYHTELVGGIGSFMALQSPNGEKYTLAVTNDGDVITKDEEGNLIIPEKPYITPQMFGAKADGVTDDTTAIQSALNQGGVVYFPAGVYKVTRQLTTTKPCVIKMFKQYPSEYGKDYPLVDEDLDLGARIDCYPSEGEHYGLLIGDGCEVDGLFMRAMNGFSGILLKYDNAHEYSQGIKYQSYPSAMRFSHIRLDCDKQNKTTTIPESMFDFYPKNKYFYILDDIVIGQGGEFATYGFRSIVNPETDRWANSVRINNLCLTGLFDYPLYVEEGYEGHAFTNWVFEGLSIQTYPYNNEGFEQTLDGHKSIMTLKRMNYCLFSGCYIWDLFAAKYEKLFDCEDLNNISCVGCSEEFDYGTKKLVGDDGEDGIETVLRNRLQEAGVNVKTLVMSTSVAEDGGNRVNLSDNYGNTIYTDLPPVALSDEQLSEGIGSWMDDNAAPIEQEGKNKLNIYSEDMRFGYSLNKDGNLVQAAAGTVNARYVVSHFIPAKCGDVFRMSHNGMAYNWSEIHEYDKDFKFLEKYTYNDEAVGTGFSVAIKNLDAAYIKVSFNTWAYMTDEDKALTTFVTSLEVVERGNFCVTFNNSDISYEPYGIKLVGGLGSYFKLQSPNGTKYSLATTDDGVIVGKDENGIIASPNIPTKTSHLENDSGFVTADDIPQAVDVPTKLSQLENDSGFITADDLPAGGGSVDLTNYYTKQEVEDKFTTQAENEEPIYGEELASANGWSVDGWTGDFANGFTHTAGNTTPLVFTMPEETAQNTYRIAFRCSKEIAPNALMVKCGGSELFDLYGQNAEPLTVGIVSVENGNVEFVPLGTFTGTITDISIKRVTGVIPTGQTITDSTGKTSFEIRTTKAKQNNIFLGNNAGENNVGGYGCVALGSGALNKNTSGFWNIGVGYNTLRSNTVGSRNVVVGYTALGNNITGSRNIALGSFALNKNTTGNKNIAIGADSIDHNISGSENVGIGYSALYNNTTGNSNLAIGSQAIAANTTGMYNTAVGAEAMNGNTTGNYNVAIGAKTLSKNGNASNNVAIGYTALYGCKAGKGNAAIGLGAGKGDGKGTFNYGVYLGYNTGAKSTTGADYNICIGYNAGDNVTTGANNICIGKNARTPTETTSNYLNIGDLIVGSMATADKHAKINGGLQLSDIPTTDPAIAGRVWNDNGTLKVSAG